MEQSAYKEFKNNFDHLFALALQRLKTEVKYHKLTDVYDLNDLQGYLHQFGLTLNAIYQYQLEDALLAEVGWLASVFHSHKWEKNLLLIIIDSWIVALEGIIKMPESTHLSHGLREVRKKIDTLFQQVSAKSIEQPDQKVQKLTELLIKGDFPSCRSLIEKKINNGLDVAEVITSLILPSMQLVGSHWQQDIIQVFQEHLATQTALRLIHVLPEFQKKSQKLPYSALISSMPGEQHTLVIVALSTFLELQGWTTYPMGNSLTDIQIMIALDHLKPQALFVSMMMLARISKALNLIEKIQKKFPDLTVFVGGRGTIQAKKVFQKKNIPVVEDFHTIYKIAKENIPHA